MFKKTSLYLTRRKIKIKLLKLKEYLDSYDTKDLSQHEKECISRIRFSLESLLYDFNDNTKRRLLEK